MANRDSVLLPNDKNKLSDLINEQLVALNKALIDNKGNEVATKTITTLQDGLKNLLKKIFEKKGVITPDETNQIIDQVEETKKMILEESYDNSQSSLAFLQIFGMIILAIFIVKVIK